MIKAIIFDVGGTYLQGSFINFVNKSYKLLGIKGVFSADKEVVFDVDYNRGKIGIEKCFRKYFGVPISEEQMNELKKIWMSTWHLNDDMKDLVQKLGKHYRLAVLSNSDPVNSKSYIERGWYDPFEVVVLSHEEGVLKPDIKIYEKVLESLELPAEECVFIDDQEDALAPARALGMKTILYESTDGLENELKKFGITINL